MGKNKGKQFNIEKRAMLSRMIAKSNKAKEIILIPSSPHAFIIQSYLSC